MTNEIWKELCFLLADNIDTDISESDFEQSVIQALRVLGWKAYLGEIEVRPSIPIGAANRITPDFVIKSTEDRKLFVMEIKQPSIPINRRFQQQLFSYMRQLKLDYGILIGQSIQLFYDGSLAKHEDPVLLESISFSPEDQKGHRFVELFSKENFNQEALALYTTSKLEKLNQKEQQKQLSKKILSLDFKETIKDLIKQNFLNQYDGELVDIVLDQLNIEVKSKQESIPVVKKNQVATNIKREKRTVDGMKIGKFVQESFRRAYGQGLISEVEINNLQDLDYSKSTFKQSRAVLKAQHKEIKDQTGRNRYYASELFCGNYYLSSQWNVSHWVSLLVWLDSIGYDYKT